MPTRYCRCRRIREGSGRDASINRRHWLAQYRIFAARGCCTAGSSARATPQQVGVSKIARADKAQGAYRVPSGAKANMAGRRLVPISDMLTSGATVDAYARALLQAGAAHVDVLVFARVVAAVRTPI